MSSITDGPLPKYVAKLDARLRAKWEARVLTGILDVTVHYNPNAKFAIQLVTERMFRVEAHIGSMNVIFGQMDLVQLRSMIKLKCVSWVCETQAIWPTGKKAGDVE